MTNQAYPIAVIRFGDLDRVDAVLEEVAARMLRRGFVVDGFLQREGSGAEGCCSTMYLQPLGGGTLQAISQNLGRHSTGCRLDPQALAALCGPLIARLGTDTDLLIVNRFGKGESLGTGFRSAIENAFMLGIPVLTAVRDTYWEAWQAFTSGEFCCLSPDVDQADAWARMAVAAAGKNSHAA